MRIFEAHNGAFDLLFTDVVLPDKDGLQLIDSIKKHKPEIRILLTSGYTDQKSQWLEIRNKGYNFLQKPYNLIDLLSHVADALVSHQSEKKAP
jgi:DNA-binding NtrC family response regulator